MEKTPNIADIIASYFNQNKSLQESAAGLGAIILEIKREKHLYGKNTRRLAALQEKAILMMLDRNNEKSNQPKRSHLKVVK